MVAPGRAHRCRHRRVTRIPQSTRTDVAERNKADRLVAVIVVIITVEAGQLQVLLIKRSANPFKDSWSLPGGRLMEDDSLLEAATRRLEIETGVKDVFLGQLYTFSDLADHRSVAVPYFALVD